MATVETESVAHAPSRRRLWPSVSAVGLLAAGIIAWVVTAPDTVRTADMANALVPIGPGETYYEGYYALNGRDIVVEQVTAVATPGVTAEPLLCEPVPDVGYIGNITRDELDQFCLSAEPVAVGTVVPGHIRGVVQPYILVRITKHTDATEAFCGLDITYRDGWRRGTNRQGGTHQVLLIQDELDPGDDWTELAGCPLRSNN